MFAEPGNGRRARRRKLPEIGIEMTAPDRDLLLGSSARSYAESAESVAKLNIESVPGQETTVTVSLPPQRVLS